jgi:hypothetical protein
VEGVFFPGGNAGFCQAYEEKFEVRHPAEFAGIAHTHTYRRPGMDGDALRTGG